MQYKTSVLDLIAEVLLILSKSSIYKSTEQYVIFGRLLLMPLTKGIAK